MREYCRRLIWLSQAAYCKRFQVQNYRVVKDSLKRVTTHDGFLEFANNSAKTSKIFVFGFSITRQYKFEKTHHFTCDGPGMKFSLLHHTVPICLLKNSGDCNT